MQVVRRHLAVDEPLDDVRVLLEEVASRTIRWVVTYSPVRPEVALVDEDLAAALVDEAGRPRLGHPGAVDLAALEGVERLGVLLRQDRHVAAARRCRSRGPCSFSQVRSATSWVLPSCGVAIFLPSQVGGRR